MAEALTKAGRYQIVGELGRGSMGVVYEGYDPVIGRTVAIKTMLAEGLAAQDFEEYKARFQREARAAGILAHPNIVTIYDFGEDNGLLYLAMEYLEGKNLEQLVQEQGILTIETILPIYDQVCSALDHAHRRKIVHRDVKPANIVILRDGLVKVTDFGIAKIMAMGMTQMGQILGTPNYMSPEQVKGRQIDGRSDIFSLGVILYELVTGEKPFGGQNITTVIYKIINENPIPPRELDASIPAGLSYIITKALAKNVNERYQTCRELAEDLRNYKSLAGVTTGQGTMVLGAPPVLEEATETALPSTVQSPVPPLPVGQTASAPLPQYTMAVSEVPIGRSFDETDIMAAPEHESVPAQKPIPQIAWVLGAVLVVAILGVISYFLVLRPKAHRQGPPRVAQVALPQNRQQPVTTATQPSALPTGSAVPTGSALPTDTALATAVNTSAPVSSPKVNTEVAAPPAASKPPASPPEKQQARVRPAAAEVGQLAVSANVNGAHISVDGRSDPSWVTPYTLTDLSAGAHNVVISMDGYEDFQQSVMIEEGETSNVVGTLTAPRAEVDINTVPSGVEVLIDGKSYGPSPVRATLAMGNHTYSVKQPGMAPIEKTFTVRSAGLITKTLTISAAATTGVVEVHTTPPGATVQADGTQVGGQTPTSFRLSVGSHVLVISMAGHKPIQQQITVVENGKTPIDVTLGQ